ncbi:hypothetical protein [Nocardia pneumoniae]|uniref:hypothetical protein n=1 Tax=Nocardia pneumoniae TaxID=228601 RepID=UPI0012F6D23E|nr:hypothetical protein [Nocardia pneumoniae]
MSFKLRWSSRRRVLARAMVAAAAVLIGSAPSVFADSWPKALPDSDQTPVSGGGHAKENMRVQSE